MPIKIRVAEGWEERIYRVYYAEAFDSDDPEEKCLGRIILDEEFKDCIDSGDCNSVMQFKDFIRTYTNSYKSMIKLSTVNLFQRIKKINRGING